MPAATYDFTIEQGTTFERQFIWRDENSVPIDLTGHSARMQVRSAPNSAAELLELTDTNGRIELGGTDGTITLKLDAAETAALNWPGGEGVYDLELEASGGQVTRLVKGSITLDPEVTR